MSFSNEEGWGRPPVYFTRFVGGFDQIKVLREVVATAGSRRLITLVGSGGSGKTRLAAEVVGSASSGHRTMGLISSDVGWVDLVEVSHGEQLLHAVATAVGLPHGQGADLTGALAGFFGERQGLVVLDGCEELATASRQLVESLLAVCPRLVVLATSHVPLRSPMEQVIRVRPLDCGPAAGVPATPDATVPTQAAELFLDRAAVALPTHVADDLELTMVDAVCQRVGGSPLAIELAASWVDAHTVRGLLAALEAGSRTAADPGADSPLSVPAVLNVVWSWLDERDQQVLRRLAAFAGDFTRESAEAVAGADLAALAALTRRCLIARIADIDDASRYRMHPLVRHHAVCMLDRDRTESGTVRRRHFDFCLGLATSPPGGQGDRHELLHPSLQAEFEVALERGRGLDDVEPVLRLLAEIHRNQARWNTPTRFLAILEAELARAQICRQPTPEARAGTLEAAGWAAARCGDHELAIRRFAEAADLYLGLDARARQATSLRGLARAHLIRGETGVATVHLRESLRICRRVADLSGAAWCGLHLAEVSSARGDPDAAIRQLSLTIKDFERLGLPLGAYCGYVRLGGDQLAVGRLPEAVDAYAQALALGGRWQFVIGMGDLLTGLATVAAELHRPVRAATLLGARRTWVDTFGRSSLNGTPEARVNGECEVGSQIGDEHFASAVGAGMGLDATHAWAEAELAVQELAGVCRRLRYGITEREVEVLRLVAEGLTNTDIAQRLELSPRTVHAHLRSAYGKLGVGARTAAVRQAANVGLI